MPLAAGGPTDTVARVLAEQLSKLWGQQVVVENKAGGGTNIGNAYVAHAEPDGYTVLYGTSSLAVNDSALSLARLQSDDGSGAGFAGGEISVLHVRAEFLAGKNGRGVHRLRESASGQAASWVRPAPAARRISPKSCSCRWPDCKMTHVPYRGAAPAFIDLIPGRIDCYFGSGELLTYSRSGQVRAWERPAHNDPRRRRTLPTIAEAGVPGYAVDSWQGVFLPGKTPPQIVQKMSADIIAVLAEPAIIDKLAQTAYAASGSSPGELREFLEADTAKWNAVIKTAGIKID